MPPRTKGLKRKPPEDSCTLDLLKPVKSAPRLPAEATKMETDKFEECRTGASSADTDRAKVDAKWATDHPAGGPPPPPGQRGDGTFRMTFIPMGAGDCAIMATPEGRIVMVDCGTNDAEDKDEARFKANVTNILNRRDYLLNYNRLDVLILSHPDKDHYNKLGLMLPLTCAPRSVYHSDFRDQYSQGDWLYDVEGTSNLCRRVDLSADSITREIKATKGKTAKNITVPLGRTWLSASTVTGASPPQEERLDGTDGGLVVLYEKGKCKITILAGGVEYDYERDSDDGTNRGSLVTLVEVYDKRFLLCADATRSTERYLMNRRAGSITNLDIVTAGHHGSKRTSSFSAYVDSIEPKDRVIVSCGLKGLQSHRLPSWRIVDRYRRRLNTLSRPRTTDHAVGAWADDDTWSESDIDERVFTTGAYGEEIQVIVPPATPVKGL